VLLLNGANGGMILEPLWEGIIQSSNNKLLYKNFTVFIKHSTQTYFNIRKILGYAS
jgi:hypothetical protein